MLGFELLLILLLILANGVFAMSEIAVVSARKSRLRERAEAGDGGARRALDLAENPTRFLSTVQIGITLVGIFTGAYGGASVAGQLATSLRRWPAVAPYSEELALAIVVALLTFLSLVLGELVPKSIGLNHPERIAAAVAGPMNVVSRVASPLVKLLTLTTDGALRLMGIRRSAEPPVTEAEVAALLRAGAEAGVFEDEEHEMVERVFWLGDRRAAQLMTPRHRIDWLDVQASPEEHRVELMERRHSHYLVADGEIDTVLGMVRTIDLLAGMLEGGPLDLRACLRKPLFVPERLPALRLLELFRESGIPLAVVIDEYGGVAGMVMVRDVLTEIVGAPEGGTDPLVHRREDGSWLVDASLPMDELWERLGLPDRRVGDRGEFHTLGGFVVTALERIPRPGETFEAHGLRFEVVDMDGHRVDKVLVMPPVGDREPPGP